jgi:hypothetical protein
MRHYTSLKARFVGAICVCVLAISALPAQASGITTQGAGGKISFIAGHFNPGFGLGGHYIVQFSLGQAGELAIYPNLEFWLASDHDHFYVDPPYYRYYHLTYFGFDFNLDAKYYFPIPHSVPVRPFVGIGPAPLIIVANSDYPYPGYDYTDIGVGFNFFTGIDFPMGSALGFAELRGKLGNPYDAFLMSFGVTFPFK